MAKEKITGAEAMMRSLEYQGVKTLSDIPEVLSCLLLMLYIIIKIH